MIWYLGYDQKSKTRRRVWFNTNCTNTFVTGKNLFCSGAVANWRVWAIAPTHLRYSKNHIGLGTKKFVDSLGSC